MTPSRFPHITDELLSAYLDEAVTAEEKRLIEAALADEPALAWRLESLRQTVQLVRTLPAIALPRSFTLTELPGVAHQPAAALAGALPARRAPGAVPQKVTSLAALWEGWRSFWHLGSPLLRNAAAVSLALFLFLVVGDAVGGAPFGQRRESTPAPFAAEAPIAAEAPAATATGEQVALTETGPVEGPVEGPADLVAKQDSAPAAPPAIILQSTDADEMRRSEAAPESGPSSLAAADRPEMQPGHQDELSMDGGAAPGAEQGIEIAAASAAGEAQDDAQSMTAESVAVAVETHRAFSATTATTLTVDETPSGEDEVLPASAPLSETETLTLADSVQADSVEDVAPASADAASVESDPDATDATATPVDQAEEITGEATGETIVSTTSAENTQPADDGLTTFQPVAEVQPAEEPAPVDPLRRLLLDLSQIVTGLVTLVFGALWWRSRSTG
jgi:anti-sigma factor RsiW